MQMANALLQRGHKVRIAYRRRLELSVAMLTSLVRSIVFPLCGIRETGWLTLFRGKKESFLCLRNLHFQHNEVVIAVGNDSVNELQSLDRSVVKIRFCHGLVEDTPAEMERVWGGPMLTIAVSPNLVSRLEQYFTTPVLGIVPNGISASEYFVEQRNRQCVGFIYHGSPLKGSEVSLPLLNSLHKRFPRVPCLVFGSYPKPRMLSPCEYTRYPSIAQAREIYNRCKIWFVTSRDEGFCLPILEAMACGCAVVSSNHTNASQLISHGLNGFIAPYADIAEYVEISNKLLSDEKLRKVVVEEGFKTVRRFTWEAASARMEGLLLAATNGKSQQPELTAHGH